MLIEAIKPENFPELILCNFLTRVCESSTHDLCVLPLQICKVKCDWFLSADVTEIVLVARVRRRYFRRRRPTAGNTSAFAGYKYPYCQGIRQHKTQNISTTAWMGKRIFSTIKFMGLSPTFPEKQMPKLLDPPKNKSDLPLPPSQLSVAYDICQK